MWLILFLKGALLGIIIRSRRFDGQNRPLDEDIGDTH